MTRFDSIWMVRIFHNCLFGQMEENRRQSTLLYLFNHISRNLRCTDQIEYAYYILRSQNRELEQLWCALYSIRCAMYFTHSDSFTLCYVVYEIYFFVEKRSWTYTRNTNDLLMNNHHLMNDCYGCKLFYAFVCLAIST